MTDFILSPQQTSRVESVPWKESLENGSGKRQLTSSKFKTFPTRIKSSSKTTPFILLHYLIAFCSSLHESVMKMISSSIIGKTNNYSLSPVRCNLASAPSCVSKSHISLIDYSVLTAISKGRNIVRLNADAH